MESVPLDVLIQLSEELPTVDLLKLCKTSKKLKRICDNPRIWIDRLSKDYNINYEDIQKDNSIKNKNPKHVYAQIYENSLICKRVVFLDSFKDSKPYFLDSFKDPELFYDKDDYYVYLYLCLKILNEFFNDDYFDGYYSRFIRHLKDKYNGVLNASSRITFEEFSIFKYICLHRIKHLEDFQKAVFNRMFSEVTPISIPVDVTWGRLCGYNIFH